MTVKELIEALSELPQDAKVFYGQKESYLVPGSDLPVFALYDFVPVHYRQLRSCRSQLPTVSSVKDNVVVFEYD